MESMIDSFIECSLRIFICKEHKGNFHSWGENWTECMIWRLCDGGNKWGNLHWWENCPLLCYYSSVFLTVVIRLMTSPLLSKQCKSYLERNHSFEKERQTKLKRSLFLNFQESCFNCSRLSHERNMQMIKNMNGVAMRTWSIHVYNTYPAEYP